MSRRIILGFLIILIIFTVILVAILGDIKTANEQVKRSPLSQVPLTPTQSPSVPQTILQLFPNPALPDSEGNITIDVSMNTYNNKVAATQFTVQYNPGVLKFISIKPDDAFYNAKVVIQNVNEATGTITYAMALPTQLRYHQISGNYNIADIKFAVKQKEVSVIKILSASVTSPDSNQSVLKAMANTLVKNE